MGLVFYWNDKLKEARFRSTDAFGRKPPSNPSRALERAAARKAANEFERRDALKTFDICITLLCINPRLDVLSHIIIK